MPSLAIIIPVFNKWALTHDCLCSLAEHTLPDVRVARVMVVDNGSTDETPVACPALGQKLFGERFVFVSFDSNQNFGPACNAAARIADTDLLFFLNNDTVLTPDWLPPLLQEMATPNAPIGTGPVLTYGDGTVQHLGLTFFPAGSSVGHLYRHIPASHPLVARRRKFQALTAAALMVPRSAFWDANGFEEGFVNGFEDVDLCLRLTRNGQRMTVVPESKIFHLESQTPRRHDYDAHNCLLLSERHDMPQHADFIDFIAEDGYVLNVEPDLTVSIAVPPDKNEALLHRLNRDGATVEACKALLADEPYWENGHIFLSQLLAQQGNIEEALAAYSHAHRLIPSFNLVAAMQKTMTHVGRNVGSLREAYGAGVDFIMDEEKYSIKFQLLRSILLERNQRTLLPCYKDAARKAAQLREEWKEKAIR